MKRFIRKICIPFMYFMGLSQILSAQIESPVKWSFAEKKISSREAEIFIKATIQNGWHIYGIEEPVGGPVKTNIDINPANSFKLSGGVIQPAPITVYEDAFKMNVHYFEGTVIFHQKVMLTSKDAVVSGKVNFMACNHQKCLPPDEITFRIPIK